MTKEAKWYNRIRRKCVNGEDHKTNLERRGNNKRRRRECRGKIMLQKMHGEADNGAMCSERIRTKICKPIRLQ